MISDLSPGDRLSLKGKLFELQKKLSLIDLEQKLVEQYPFQPKIAKYNLPDRQRDFNENNAKADMIRKQKKQLLQDSITQQTQEVCTFAPTIYTSAEKFAHLDSRPVHIRLTEKAVQYRKSKENRRRRSQLYDDDGNRLFSPEINRKANKNSSASIGLSAEPSMTSIMTPAVNTVTADEFLYQDAKDRELRHQNLIASYTENAQNAANLKKMNALSHRLLRRKIERSAAILFAMMDTDTNELADYADVVSMLEATKLWANSPADIKLRDQQLLWTCFDHHQMGSISRKDFLTLCVAFMLNKSVLSAVTALQQYEEKRAARSSQQPSQAPEDERHQQQVANSHNRSELMMFPHESLLTGMKERDLITFQRVLSKLLDHVTKEEISSGGVEAPVSPTSTNARSLQASIRLANTPTHHISDAPAQPAFKPKIFSYSYKLAKRKEKRDLDLLQAARIAAGSTIASVASPQQQQKGGESNVTEEEEVSMRSSWDSSSAVPLLPVTAAAADAALDDQQQLPPPPTQSETDQQLGAPQSHYDKLLMRQKLSQLKKEKLAEDIKEQQLQGCTFHPQIKEYRLKHRNRRPRRVGSTDPVINSAGVSSDAALQTMSLEAIRQSLGGGGKRQPMSTENEDDDPPPPPPTQSPEGHSHTEESLDDPYIMELRRTQRKQQQAQQDQAAKEQTARELPVHERLYALKDKKRKENEALAAQAVPQREILEMEGCTFHPNIPPRLQVNANNHSSQRAIKDFDKTVHRMREGQEKSLKKKLEEENEYLVIDEKYRKGRELLMKKGPQPPKLSTAERLGPHRTTLAPNHSPTDKPDLIVDVKLSATRSTRIRIEHGEDPADAVDRFARIYGLEAEATQLLFTVVQQTIQARAVAAVASAMELEQQEKQSLASIGGSSSGERSRLNRRSSSRERASMDFATRSLLGGMQNGGSNSNHGGLDDDEDDLGVIPVDDEYSSYTASQEDNDDTGERHLRPEHNNHDDVNDQHDHGDEEYDEDEENGEEYSDEEGEDDDEDEDEEGATNRRRASFLSQLF